MKLKEAAPKPGDAAVNEIRTVAVRKTDIQGNPRFAMSPLAGTQYSVAGSPYGDDWTPLVPATELEAAEAKVAELERKLAKRDAAHALSYGSVVRKCYERKDRIRELEAELARWKSGEAMVGERWEKGEVITNGTVIWSASYGPLLELRRIDCGNVALREDGHLPFRYIGPTTTPLPAEESKRASKLRDEQWLREQADKEDEHPSVSAGVRCETSADTDKFRQNVTPTQGENGDSFGESAGDAADWERLAELASQKSSRCFDARDGFGKDAFDLCESICRKLAAQQQGGE